MREHQEKVPFDYIVNCYSKMDPSFISATLEIPYDHKDEYFELILMGQKYKIIYPSGKVYNSEGKEVLSYVLKTILIRYLVNGKGSPLTGKYITYKDIKDGQVYYPNFYKRTILKLAEAYSNQQEIFRNKLSAINSNSTDVGDFSFSFEFMKNVNFQFVLYDADEEFGASANILMDQNIEGYFNAEDLAVVVDVAIEFFTHKGISINMGMYT